VCGSAASWPINIRHVISSDEIEGHFRHLEKMFQSLRGERFIVAVDVNARLLLWDFPETDERGRKFEIFIRAFGFEIINEVHQGPPSRRGSSFINVILVSPQISQSSTHGR